MLFIEALEAVKCYDEGVLTSVADANIGSILGIGFPGWTGGVLQYVNQYAGGRQGLRGPGRGAGRALRSPVRPRRRHLLRGPRTASASSDGTGLRASHASNGSGAPSAQPCP